MQKALKTTPNENYNPYESIYLLANNYTTDKKTNPKNLRHGKTQVLDAYPIEHIPASVKSITMASTQ
jgi:hypothetical protein